MPGGRPKGSLNKRTVEVEEKLAALGGDPIAGMAQLVMDPEASRELKAKLLGELAQYVAPKRKAVEHDVGIEAHTTLLELLSGAQRG